MRLMVKIDEKTWTLTEDRSQKVKEVLEKGLKQILTDEEAQKYLTDNQVELVESSEGTMLYAIIHSNKVLVGQDVPKVPEPGTYHQPEIEDQHKCDSKELDDDFTRIVKINGDWLFQTADDIGFDNHWEVRETEIHYCPFCGEKLE